MPTALLEPGFGLEPGLGFGRQEWSQVGQRRTGCLGVETVGTIGDLQNSGEDWGLRSEKATGCNGDARRDCRGTALGQLEAERTGLT
jgi:hypothetical protein